MPGTAERIISASLSLIRDRHSPHLDVNSVAERAGVSLEMLRSIYPDNRALDMALVEYGLVLLVDRCSQASAKTEGAMRQISAIAHATIDWGCDYPVMLRLICGPRTVPLEGNDGPQRFEGAMRELVRRLWISVPGQEDTTPEEFRLIFRSLRAHAIGLALAAANGHLGDEGRAEAHQAIDMFAPAFMLGRAEQIQKARS